MNLRRNLRRSFQSVLIIVCLSSWGVAIAGPLSTLYLTAGDNQLWFTVQGNTVTQLPEVHQYEYALAVRNTVRTYSGYPFSIGNEYTLAGAPLATTYANGFGSQMLDGTTDGTFNYAVQWNQGKVVRFGLDWTSPTVVASNLDPDTIGITYNPFDGTFWTASRQQTRIYHYSSSFSLLGSFVTAGAISGLAFDPADGTLWGLNANAGNRLDQYSTGGVLLSSLSDTQIANANTLGAEFALIPEPATTSLLGIGGLMMLRLARRKN